MYATIMRIYFSITAQASIQKEIVAEVKTCTLPNSPTTRQEYELRGSPEGHLEPARLNVVLKAARLKPSGGQLLPELENQSHLASQPSRSLNFAVAPEATWGPPEFTWGSKGPA